MRLEDAVREMELFVQYGTNQNGPRMIPNAGPAGDDSGKDSGGGGGSNNPRHCSPATLKLLVDGQKLIQLRRALAEAVGGEDGGEGGKGGGEASTRVMNRHKKWQAVILPLALCRKHDSKM